MDAFESVMAMLLRRNGYWTATSVKVDLTKEQKRRIGRPTSPRWEIDLVAYKGSTNQILAVECKSYLDSTGVVFRNKCFEYPERFKLFTDERLRKVVLNRLGEEYQLSGACAPNPKVCICLAAGKIAAKTNLPELRAFFDKNGWLLFDSEWIRDQLLTTAQAGYENDVAYVVSKILWRKHVREEKKIQKNQLKGR